MWKKYKHLQFQSTVKLEPKSKPEQSVGKRTKLGRKIFDEITKKEKNNRL